MNSRAQGFTLVEVLVVTLLSALIMGSIYQMVVMQDRTTRQQYAVVETQQNARTALAVMTNDLKEVSAVDGDVTAADSTTITFRALKKAGVSCAKPDDSNLDVVEQGGPFVAGDSVLVFAEGNAASENDDAWLVLEINSVNAAVCVSNPLGALASQQKRLNFNGSPLANVATGNGAGALVRSFVPTRYRIVDNGEWGQLMRTDTAAEIPIIDRLALLSDGGVRFRYFDAAGSQMPYNTLSANLANIMRIQVKVRGKAVSEVTSTGANRFQDSLVTTVYLRGNYRTQ